MRISDWSSDVCSSDLTGLVQPRLSAAKIISKARAGSRSCWVSPSLPGVSGWSSMTTTTIRSARKILRPTAPVPYKAGRALAFLAREKAGDDLAREPRGAECFGVDAAPARLHLGAHILAALDDRLVKGPTALPFPEHHRRATMILQA